MGSATGTACASVKRGAPIRGSIKDGIYYPDPNGPVIGTNCICTSYAQKAAVKQNFEMMCLDVGANAKKVGRNVKVFEEDKMRDSNLSMLSGFAELSEFGELLSTENLKNVGIGVGAAAVLGAASIVAMHRLIPDTNADGTSNKVLHWVKALSPLALGLIGYAALAEKHAGAAYGLLGAGAGITSMVITSMVDMKSSLPDNVSLKKTSSAGMGGLYDPSQVSLGAVLPFPRPDFQGETARQVPAFSDDPYADAYKMKI